MSRQLSVLSTTARAIRLSTRRGYASAAAEGGYFAERQAVKEHAQQTKDLWRRISFFVCVPATLVCVAWVRKVEAEHGAHIEHIKEENGGELPEVPEYDYLNKRERPFPWGMNSLFFNAHTNKDMSNGE